MFLKPEPGSGPASGCVTRSDNLWIRTPGRWTARPRRCFYDKASDAFPPCSIVDPKTPFPQPGFSSWEPCDSGSIRHGCTFDTGRCRHMRRRNPRLGRLLDRSGVAAAVHRGLVADQHASRMARRDRLGWLCARRHPSCQPHRSPARAADLSRLERAQRAVLFRHRAMRQPAPGARIPRFGRPSRRIGTGYGS